MKSEVSFRLLALSFITALCLAFNLAFPLPASADGTTNIYVSTQNQVVVSGTQFTINIMVQPGSPIAGAQFDLAYDPKVVTINRIVEGTLLKQGGANTYFIPGQLNSTLGKVHGVAGTIINPGHVVSDAGILAAITCTSSASKGSTSLTLSNVIIGDANGQSIPVSISNGQLSIDSRPILQTIGNKMVYAETSLVFTLKAGDLDGDLLTYSAANLPPGASFDPDSRTFSWTPGANQAGSYPAVHFQVSDGSLTASEDITVTVNRIIAVSVMTNAANNISANGVTLNGTLTSSGGTGSVTVSFEYGLTNSYGTSITATIANVTPPAPFSASVNGLTSNTLYHYRSKAVGVSIVYGADQTFLTMSNPSPPVSEGAGLAGGGFGFANPTPVVTTINAEGLIGDPLTLNQDGITTSLTTLVTDDKKVALKIPQGITMTGPLSSNLNALSCAKLDSFQATNGNEVVMGYEFGPDGSTFSPGFDIIFNFDPEAIPEGLTESDLKIAYWSDGAWQTIKSSEIDLETGYVSFLVTHFTTYALIRPIPITPALPAIDSTPDNGVPTPISVTPQSPTDQIPQTLPTPPEATVNSVDIVPSEHGQVDVVTSIAVVESNEPALTSNRLSVDFTAGPDEDIIGPDASQDFDDSLNSVLIFALIAIFGISGCILVVKGLKVPG